MLPHLTFWFRMYDGMALGRLVGVVLLRMLVGVTVACGGRGGSAAMYSWVMLP